MAPTVWRLRAWAGLGALVWAAVTAVRLSFVPGELWRWRDDAVITLSHAYGWAVSGVPSVSASGERIEGFTAPLQFFVASGFYALGGSGWAVFLDVQTVVGVLATGYFLTRFLQHAVPSAATRWPLLVAAGFTALLGVLAWPAVGWLVSGMESAFTVPLLAAVMAGLAAVDRQRGWALGLATGLAGVSRTEFAALLLPVLLVVVVPAVRGSIPRAVAARVVLVAGALWGAVHLWRLVTFGTVIPNSAFVQGKTGVVSASLLFLLLPAGAVVVGLLLRRRPRAVALVGVVVCLVAVLAAVGLVPALPERLGLRLPEPATVSVTAVAAALLVLATLELARRRIGMLPWLALVLVGTVPIVQRALFGTARLDYPRVLSMSVLLLAAAAGIFVLGLVAVRRRAGQGRLGVVTGLLVTAAAVVAGLASVKAYTLCCDVEEHAGLLRVAETTSTSQGIPRVIFANPDLGKLSFPKQVVTADLGLLGDQLLATVHAERPHKVVDLLNRVVMPDLVESHGTWSCYYTPWLRSPRFEANYVVVAQRPPDKPRLACAEGGAYTVFARTDRSGGLAREVALTSSLASDPGEGPQLVGDALRACAAVGDDPLRCQWVRRAVQRTAPELREAGAYDGVVSAFTSLSPTPQVDRLLLTTPPGWAGEAAEALYPVLTDRRPVHVPSW